MTVRRLALIALLAASAPALSGCLIIGGTALVAGTAVGVAGDTLQFAGNVGEGVVRAAIPGDGEDDEDEDRDGRQRD
ncbi:MULTISPECIES: hypothetical protein [Hyphobacterium]|uniref:Lipoprotein n=1 Tax=Hyphobacterium vulgare TaxID=1736751 RepID=A0ABV6ZZJ0_9PROT